MGRSQQKRLELASRKFKKEYDVVVSATLIDRDGSYVSRIRYKKKE